MCGRGNLFVSNPDVHCIDVSDLSDRRELGCGYFYRIDLGRAPFRYVLGIGRRAESGAETVWH